MKMPTLFKLLMDIFKKRAPLKGKGVVSETVNNYEIKITADEGQEIKPFYFHVFKNGWLIAVISPEGGTTLGNIEDELIKEFKEVMPTS